MSTPRFYGWRAPSQDKLDRAFKFVPQIAPENIPSKIDLRNKYMPPVYDQLQLGGCTGNAIAGLAQFLMNKVKGVSYRPSRLAIYYDERVIEGTVSSDAGAELADGMKVVRQQGVAHETLWPYDITKFADAPPANVVADAAKHKISQELNLVQDINHFKACLAAGYPFVGGFTVYSSFESQQVAETGIVNMPAAGEQQVGGHAILIVGYDDSTKRLLVRNSWGPSWGLKGFFEIPYAYYTNPNLATDFWTAHSIAM